MVEKTPIWSQMQKTQNAIVQNLSPKLQETIKSSIFNGVDGWFQIGLAYYIRPDPMTIKRIRQRNPYTRQEKLAQGIQNLKDVDFLDANSVVTDKAYDAYQELLDAQDAIASEITLMPEDKSQALVTYIERIHNAVAKLDAPCFKDSSNKPLPANLVHRIYYLIARLAAWRDDAHIKAWQPLDIDGHTYETFSLVWDGTATIAEKFMEVRAGRGYEEVDWQVTLDKLVDKGWLIKEADAYTVSADGKEIRDDIEVKTDEIFYAPFSVLEDTEIEHLLTLLKDVQERFTPEPEAN